MSSNAVLEAERGLPIMKRTLCVTGTHTFVEYGVGHQLPDESARCDCGLVSFGDVSPASREEEP